MKIKIYLLFAASAVLFFSQKANATHAIGADLTIRCLSGDSLALTLKFYRDCSGMTPDTDQVIEYNSKLCGISGKTLVRLTKIPIEVTPVCGAAVNTCNGGSYPGAQEWVYKGNVVLKNKCTDWIFSFTECCRNTAITNVINPGTHNLHVKALYNNTLCNSTPVFTTYTVPWICLGQKLCLNYGVTDAERDSLVYSLVAPENADGDTLQYAQPYSSKNPLSSSSKVTIDSRTGDICMTPSKLEVTVIAMRVDEYRDGVLISSVVRDMQFVIVNCYNGLPTASGINGTTADSISVCAGTPVCFKIYATDPDSGQKVTMTWNHSIAGATFKQSTTNPSEATFCWTPKVDETITGMRNFRVTLNDNACPFSGIQSFTYYVEVKPAPTIKASSKSICPAVDTKLSASGGYNYSWTPAGKSGASGNSIMVAPTVTTNYTVTGSGSNGCTASAIAKVEIQAPSTSMMSITADTSICEGSSVQLTASGATDYKWSNGSTMMTMDVQPDSTVVYSVEGTDLKGCKGIASVKVTVNSPPSVNAGGNVFACKGDVVNLTPDRINPQWKYNWWPVDAVSPSSSAATTFAGDSTTTLFLTAEATGTGCGSATDSVTVFVYDSPKLNAGKDTTISVGTEAHLHSYGSGTMEWSDQLNLLCSACNSIVVSPENTSRYYVKITDANGCRTADTVTVYVEDVITLFIANAFAPHKNGRNNLFKAYGVGVEEFDMVIYNRWGQEVFHSNDINDGWDGTCNGSPVQSDVYVYTARATSYTGKDISRTGRVTLFR